MKIKSHFFTGSTPYFLAAIGLFASFLFVKPALAYNPLDFTATQNGTIPSQQDSRGGNNPATITIKNNAPAGSSSMAWSFSLPVTWLSASQTCHGTGGCPFAGFLAPGASDTITVTPNTTSMAPSDYNTTITINAYAQSGAVANPATITATVDYIINTGPPGIPGGSTAANTTIDATVACTHIKVSWTAASGSPTSYYIYRSAASGNPTSGGNPWLDTGSTSLSYDYVPGSQASYYYWVAAHNAGGTSALAGPTVAVSPTPCQADFSLSNKLLVKINNIPYPYTSNIGCIGNASGSMPQTIRSGDTTSWSLNLCNNGNKDAINVVLTDTLTDLTPVNGTYFVTLTGGSPTATTPSLSGSCATGSCTLTFNIASIPKNKNALVTFDATTTVPAGTTQTLNRFRNQGSFYYAISGFSADNGGCTGTGTDSSHQCVLPDPGYKVFYNGSKAPTQTEINP